MDQDNPNPKWGYKYGKYLQNSDSIMYPHIPKLIQVSRIPLNIYKKYPLSL